jgi:hypothetical protein
VKKLQRVRGTVKAGAIAVACAVLVTSVAAACSSIAHSASNQPNFTITNTISSSATTQTAALLYPGVPRYLWYTAHNPLKVQITVRTLSISSVRPPAGCTTANLDYASTTFTGSLVVPAQGTNSVPVPISLFETHTNQDSCENKVFGFTFQGSATYNVVTSTQTQLSSSHNPSAIGQPVTYTAIVSDDGTGNHQTAGSPTGSVTFYDGSTVICAGVPVVNGSNDTSSATCTPPAYLVTGVHPITAIYTNVDGNYSDSTSPILHQIVQSARKSSTILTSQPDPSVVGAPVTLIAKVFGTPPVPSGSSPSGSVSFYLGLPIGTHTLLGTEVLDATGKAVLTTSTLPEGSDNVFAVYSGDAQFTSSTSPVIIQVVLAKAGHCSDPYNSWYFGDPGSSSIHGSTGNNYFYLPSGNFQVFGGNGSNCFQGGDGNDGYNGGNGHNHVYCGNGNNSISLGSGDDTVQIGDGTNQISAGDGNDSVTIGNGDHNKVILGNGNDAVITGSGAFDTVQLGSGTDSVTIGGSQTTVTGSSGSDTVYLGSGTSNSFTGGGHHNVCHLPTPPSSWHGTAQSYYHDTLANCTVVTP